MILDACLLHPGWRLHLRMLAAREGHTRIVEKLIRTSASVNLRNQVGFTTNSQGMFARTPSSMKHLGCKTLCALCLLFIAVYKTRLTGNKYKCFNRMMHYTIESVVASSECTTLKHVVKGRRHGSKWSH